MVGPEHVAAGVMGRWQVTLARVNCPGGIWYGKVNEQAVASYAMLVVTAEPIVRISDGRYHRLFAVRISVWGDAGADKFSAGGTARAAIEAMMPGLTVPEAIKVVDIRTGTGELNVEDSPRNASDVCLATMEWRVLIEGN